MLCGIEWWAFISKNNVYRICRLCNLSVKKDFNSKREVLINDESGTWLKEGKYKGWIIQVRKCSEGYKLHVRGSLHKFYHGNNAGTFSGREVIGSIQGMCDLFEIEPQKAFVLNIEVGINMPVDCPVYQYLSENLLYHKKREKEEYEKMGIGFKFRHDDYWIKLYQKEKYKLRFEIKYKAKAKLDLFSVTTIADLSRTAICKLAESLLSEWQEVIMRGGIDLSNEKENPNRLTKDEWRKLEKFSSTFYQQSYEVKLKMAKDAGDKKKSNALKVKAYRLRSFCMNVIAEKGDGRHKQLAIMIKEGVESFKGSWGK